jgi:putative ABC transport system permease protein
MIFKLAIKNILHYRLSTLLSSILIISSVSLLLVIISIENKVESHFKSNLQDVDMVLGASGSPLQLILSSVFHIDNPTGNINYKEAQIWMNHRFIKEAIPLAYGDSYKGYKILGTTTDFIYKYDCKLLNGKINLKESNVVLGNSVAKNTGLKVGDSFSGQHGGESGEIHKDYKYKVVGILKATNKNVDQLIISSIESIWKIHEHEEMHEHHEHHSIKDPESQEPDKEITAVLLTFKNPMAIIQLPRLVKEKSKNMQLAIPIIEINRLFHLFGIGLDTLYYLVLGISIISCLSIFISMLNNLKSRKYEMAVLRSMGLNKYYLFSLVIIEGLITSFFSFILGVVTSKIIILFISQLTESNIKINLVDYSLLFNREGIVLIYTILLTFIASLIPAIITSKTDVYKVLINENK